MATVQEFEQFMTDLESFKDSLAEPDMKGPEREDYIEDEYFDFIESVKGNLVTLLSTFITKNKNKFEGKELQEILDTYVGLKDLEMDDKIMDIVSSSSTIEDVNLDSVINSVFTIKGRNTVKNLNMQTILDGTYDLVDVRPKKVSVRKSDEALVNLSQMLPSLKGKEKEIVNTLMQYLQSGKSLAAGKGAVVVEVEGDRLVSFFDLKKTNRRKQIYDYWGELDYETFSKAYNDCKEKLEGLEVEDNPELKKIIDEFSSHSEAIKNGKYDYIIELDSVELKDVPILKNMGYSIVNTLFSTYGADLDDAMLFDSEDLDEEDSLDRTGDELENETWGVFGVEFTGKEGGAIRFGEMADPRKLSTTQEADNIEYVSALKTRLSELQDVKVDPLFYYAYTQSPDKFGSVVFEQDGKQIKNLDSIIRRARTAGRVVAFDIDNTVVQYVNQMKKNASLVDRKEYSLPYTKTLQKEINLELFDLLEKPDIDGIVKFFDDVTAFLEVKSGPSRIGESKRKKKRGRESAAVTLAGVKRRGFYEEIEDAQDEFRNLLSAIADYFLVPASSRFFPFDEEIEFVKKAEYTAIVEKLDKDTYPFFAASNLFLKYENSFLTQRNIEEITEILSKLTRPNAIRRQAYFKAQLMKLHDVVDDIFMDDKFEELSKIEIGSYFDDVISDEDNDLDEDTIFGESTEKWKDDYNKSTLYPLELLFKHIRKEESAYSELYASSVKRFISMVEDMKIIKSEEELDIIDAHGEIRKMLGKPVYNNVFKTDNYDHVNDIMTIIKEDYNVSITAHEIENIVYEIDSMESIGRKYGVSSDVVYFLKANFR